MTIPPVPFMKILMRRSRQAGKRCSETEEQVASCARKERYANASPGTKFADVMRD